MRPALLLQKTLSIRQLADRRRLAVIAAFLGLALASGLLGALTHPAGDLAPRPATGPFSYFPT